VAQFRRIKYADYVLVMIQTQKEREIFLKLCKSDINKSPVAAMQQLTEAFCSFFHQLAFE
jgi:hypothetical protein